MKMFLALMILYYYFLSFGLPTLAEQCGSQAGGETCPGQLCCSKWGWCGTTDDYCGPGCQSNCPSPPAGGDDLSHLITKQTFENMLLHRNGSPNCAVGFYTYEAFITAAKSFPSFGNTGTTDIRKRELAAFFGQTSHETTGNFCHSVNRFILFVDYCIGKVCVYIYLCIYRWLGICAGRAICLGLLLQGRNK